jgi:hypothetical protein
VVVVSAPQQVAAWPSARVDAVARLRAMAAALPHAAYCERTLDAPFDAVWAVYGDLERGVPRFEWSVRSLEIVRREGEALELVASGPLGERGAFRALWRPGWCVMTDASGAAQIGMAAAPEGANRTRVAHFEGHRRLGWIARPFLTRAVRRDLERLAKICERRS